MGSFLKICFVATITMFTFGLLAPSGIAGEEVYTLDNGLIVILSEIPGAGAVSGYLAFKVGSGDERDETEHGTAHLLEHLLFRNQSRTGDGLVSTLVQENGGYVNAFTTKEMTAYTLNLPTEAALLLPSLLIDLTINAQFAPEQLAEEQEIIVEEINGYTDKADYQFFQFTDAKYYGKDHPYGRSIAASPEAVRGATGRSVRDFHGFFYRPDNAVLVLAGEFAPDAMKQAVYESARAWFRPDSPLAARTKTPVPRLDKAEVAVKVDKRATLAKAFINFPAFSGSDNKAIAARVLASLLSGGQASRLDAKVWRDLELVNGITAYLPITSDDGRLIIMLAAQPDKLEQAIVAVFEVLDDLFVNPPDQTELERARSLLKKHEFSSQDDSKGIAMALISSTLTEGNWRNHGLFGARVDAVGVEALLSVAREILSRRPVVTVMLPEGDDEAVTTMTRNVETAVRGFAISAEADQAHAAPGFVELEPVEGIRLVAMRDPNRSLVNVVAMTRGGLLPETHENNGIGRLMVEAWPKATTTKPSRTLSREMEQLGATIKTDSGLMTTGLSGEFLGDNWGESLRLFTEILISPAFDASDVEEARRDLLARLGQRDQNLNARVTQLADEAQYAGHPFSLETEGREDVVKALEPGDLANWHQRLMQNSDLIIAIAGDIDLDEARAIVVDGLGGWRDRVGKSLVDIPLAPSIPDSPVVTKKAINRTQTHLIMAFPAPDMYSPDREPMKVLETSLNGLGGTLMVELREKRKLAYTTYSIYKPGLGVGGIQFYISNESTKTGTALDGMTTVLRDLVDNGLSEEEVDAAKRLAVGQYRIFSQTLAQKTMQAAINLVNDRAVNYQELYLERLKAVTTDDVRRVIAKYLSLEHAIVAVLGPEASIDMVGE